ncbi:hypothetical protein CKY01_06470 [Photorhabdus laumondii subsp. clarkei]|uniref:Uncharacterized protein n=1 Tax=Photorhabdus laumondii subsp. clarkei TaxID=2029685 RepID=A0A329VJD1_9GAMM|nr:hypothetical protein CKY01_06470 [Photorhabdus laumondii subsp. clarkei]
MIRSLAAAIHLEIHWVYAYPTQKEKALKLPFMKTDFYCRLCAIRHTNSLNIKINNKSYNILESKFMVGL